MATRPFLCTISGIDGSGKSTYAKALAEQLQLCGFRATTVWLRYRPPGGLVASEALRTSLLGHEPRSPTEYANYLSTRKSLMAKLQLHTVILPLLVITYAYSVILQLKRLNREADVLIADRFILDTGVDWVTEHGFQTVDVERAMSVLFGLVPEPQVEVFLDVDPHTAEARKQQEVDSSLLRAKYSTYLDFIRTRPNVCIIPRDTDLPAGIKKLAERIRHDAGVPRRE